MTHSSETPAEIFGPEGVIASYLKFVEAGGSVDTFGEALIDPKRKELNDPLVICYSAREQLIAQRGLWRHLGIAYRGIQKRTKRPDRAISDTTENIFYTADDYRRDSRWSIDELNRAFDYDEGIWLPAKAYEDPTVAEELARSMLVIVRKCPIETSDQLDFARRAHAHRARFWRDELESLAINVREQRAHPALIKWAESIIDYRDPEESLA